MRLRGTWRRGSLAWQVVSYSAFLVMSLFVTFDLLDLDCSHMRGPLLDEEVTAARSLVDRDCLPVDDVWRLNRVSLDIPCLILRGADGSSMSPAKLGPTPITARRARIRRPLPLRIAVSSLHAASEDPA